MPPIPVCCARCGAELPEAGGGATCPRCGATRPDPSWTQPFAEGGATVLSARASSGAGLAQGRTYALAVIQGTQPGRVIEIDKPRFTLGRVGCDAVFDDPQLSRQHAVIAINGTRIRLEDLGSTNGTFVDEERIQQAELTDRSEFRIGTQQLVFVMRDEEGF